MIGYQPQMFELSQPLCERMVRRIVEAVDPLKIVLFGSRGRGDQRPESDVDLLIIQDSPLPRHRRAIPVYAALAGVGLEVDAEVVVFTPEEVAEWSEVPSALVTTALREGKVLYAKRQS